MTILLDTFPLPEQGPVELKLNLSFEIKVTAEEARQKVNSWVFQEIGYLVLAEPPTLVVGERVVWRVPAALTYPSYGNVGTIGTLDVDVETGKMNNTPELKAQMEECGKKMAARLDLNRSPIKSTPAPTEITLPAS